MYVKSCETMKNNTIDLIINNNKIEITGHIILCSHSFITPKTIIIFSNWFYLVRTHDLNYE